MRGSIQARRESGDSYGSVQSMGRSSGWSRVLAVVTSMVVAMAIHGLTEQPSMASEVMNRRGTTQAAWLFKSSSRRFEERASRLLDRLTRIRAEVHAEDGGEFYRTMEEHMAILIRNSSPAVVVEYYRLKAKSMADDAGEKRLFFYQYNIGDIGNKKRGEYIEIPEICAARGEVWCEPTVGLYVCMIDPRIPKVAKLDGVAVPKPDENMGIMRIPVKYVINALGCETFPVNVLVYENAMGYAYRFFEGEITREELDEVIAELIERGKSDRTVLDLIIGAGSMELSKTERKKMSMESEKACYFPDIKAEREFGRKRYTVSYDNSLGYIIMYFPLD
jgi:hypothetical protein